MVVCGSLTMGECSWALPVARLDAPSSDGHYHSVDGKVEEGMRFVRERP